MSAPLAFAHQTLSQRVVFGAGASARLADEVEGLGAERVLVVAAPAEAELAGRLTADLPVTATFDEVRMHVPVEVAERARTAASDAGADLLVCIGGGSTTGTAKAVALTSGLPVLAVPTTYAGSEATPVWGLTEGRRKRTGTDPVVLPRTVVYDPELTMSLPIELSVASGLNALAHCVDSLWAPRADPISTVLAMEGARALAEGLPLVTEDGQDADGRAQCLLGAHLAAVAFAGAGSGLHHKICHVLGGTFDLPHAQTHAVVLPVVLAFNAPAAQDQTRRLAVALGASGSDGDDAVAAMSRLYDVLGPPRSLRELGLAEADLVEAADLVTEAAPADNPRPVDRDDAERLLRAAWSGKVSEL